MRRALEVMKFYEYKNLTCQLRTPYSPGVHLVQYEGRITTTPRSMVLKPGLFVVLQTKG